MLIIISVYWGILTLFSLITIAGANVAMILFGWLQEKMNPPGRISTTMLPFWFGTLVGIIPWLAMSVNIFQISQDAPATLLAVLIVQGIFFFCFGLNQWLQYREIGKWASYIFGQKTYLVLALALSHCSHGKYLPSLLWHKSTSSKLDKEFRGQVVTSGLESLKA